MSLFKSNLTAAAEAAIAAATPPALTLRQNIYTYGLHGLGGNDILAASSLLNAEVDIEGMARPFLAHQAASYLYALGAIDRWGGALIGDDMGMGKTQVLFALVNEWVRNRKPGGYAVMIAPPVAKAGYQDDLAAAFPLLRFHHLQGRKGSIDDAPAADIYFVSDDALTMKHWLTSGTRKDDKGKSHLVASNFATNAAIITRDEIHRDKGANAKPSTRAKVMLAVAEAVRGNTPIVGATGTILTNRPVEAYLPLQIIGGDAVVKAITPNSKTKFDFLRRFCDLKHNGYGYDYNGVNLDRMGELHENLRRTLYVRREKADLGDALPHGGWIIKPIALNGVLGRYQRIEDDFLALVREEEGPESMWRKARAEAITRMGALWEAAGVAKAAATVEYVKDLVDQGRQVVLFYYHAEVFEELAKGLINEGITNVIINGQVTGDARQDAIHTFQAGKAQVMLAQIRAAGMAVTLTAAADAVFCQVPWSAGDLKQAADRILRADDRSMERALRGEAVTWHVLQAAKANGDPTFDAAMWNVLELKAGICDAVNAGRPVTMSDESIMRQALESWFDSDR